MNYLIFFSGAAFGMAFLFCAATLCLVSSKKRTAEQRLANEVTLELQQQIVWLKKHIELLEQANRELRIINKQWSDNVTAPT